MERIKPYVKEIEEALAAIQLPDAPNKLYEPLLYMFGLGGKRIRPALVLLGAELFGQQDRSDVMPLALAIELFHNFTLIHDDIMDNAPLRRGKETVYKKWNTNVGILSGDVLLVKAYQMISRCSEPILAEVLSVFNAVAVEVCEGQQLDMDFESLDFISKQEYIEMIRLKTSVLLGCALKLGAICAGANVASQKAIYQYGVNLGIAFQLQDDILDVYGDENRVGKQIGGDILENKKTILLVTLMERLGDKEREGLKITLHRNYDREQDKINQVMALYREHNVLEDATKLKELYSNKAFEILESLPVEEEKKFLLNGLSHALLNRLS